MKLATPLLRTRSGSATCTRAEGPSTGFTAPVEPTSHEHFLLAAVSLAGGCAQMAANVPPDEGCMDDLNQAARHIASMLGFADVPPPSSGLLDVEMQRANALAADIADIRWSSVKVLAALLVERDELSVEQVTACLRSVQREA